MPQIVLVDDDSFYKEILLNLLKHQGAEATHYPSAKACLEALENQQQSVPDAFILDVVMPEMNGYELCQTLRSQEATAQTPILFVSSKASLDDRMKGYEAGGTDYLAKPVRPAELKEKLDLALRGVSRNLEPGATENDERIELAAMHILEDIGRVASSSSAADLAEIVISEIKAVNLSGSVLVRDAIDSAYRSSDGGDYPIEREILEFAAGNTGITRIRQRLIFNHGSVAVLVRKVSEQWASKLPQLEAHLSALIQLVDLKASAFLESRSLAAQKNHWIDLLVAAEKGISEVRDRAGLSPSDVDHLIEDFNMAINEMLIELHFDEDREAELRQALQTPLNELKKTLLSALRTDEDIDSVHKPFQTFIEKLKSLEAEG